MYLRHKIIEISFISTMIIFIQGRIKPKLDVNKFLDVIFRSQKTMAYDEKLIKPSQRKKHRVKIISMNDFLCKE